MARGQAIVREGVPAQFPIGMVRRIEDLPAGRFKTRIGELPAPARDRALAWLRSFHFCAHDLGSLQADSDGGIFYADPAPAGVPGTGEASDPVTAGAAVPVSPFPASLVFHSRPGAPNVLYLNFAGETVSNTQWNTDLGRSSIPAVAFSTDSDRTTFSDAEQVAIRRVWERVAEDYAPFNVDVTTERPGTFNNRTIHAVITRSTDANGEANPASGSGGVAYVNVFGTSTFSRYRPAWIYQDNLGSDEPNIAEACSHEAGHNLGLSHDGTTGGGEYYSGHGSGATSWGTIMGGSYYLNVTQWSKGEYYQANNKQDDLATIAGKVTYRTDDHGGTATTATALVFTGGTNIVSTTPATDPTNTSPANKGVLAQNTDVDVFSFVTGAGPVRLRVSPWVSPGSSVRGGNLDVRIQLFDETAGLVHSVDPAGRTDVQLDTTLPAGRYFLHVRNSGEGDPLASTPTGYTTYGSIGQYFISGYVTASVGLVLPPVADLAVTGVTTTGVGGLPLTVTYSDDQAVKVSTLDGADLRVTGPNGFNRLARFVSVNSVSDGSPRVATYAVDPPGATWVSADNGTYTVSLEPQQVSDTGGTWASPAALGGFEVKIPVPYYAATMTVDPGWRLEGQWQYGTPSYGPTGPSSGYTGTRIIGYNLAGNYPVRLAATWATTPPINTAGSTALTLRFRRWLRVLANDTASIEISTNNATWTRLWGSSGRVQDSSWRDIQFALPAGFAGSQTLRVRWGLESNASQNDIGWNLDDVELLGDGALDSSAPDAILNVANLTTGGSPSHDCSVTYTDATAVRLASLDSADLQVTGPNGFVGTIEFIGADTPSDGSPVTASYSVAAPGGSWDLSDNGVYEVVLVADEVTDVFNNGVAQRVLGSFTVDIPVSRQALVVTPLALTVPEGGQAGFTVRLEEAPAAPVAVSVTQVGGDETVTVASGNALEFTPGNWSVPQAVTLAASVDPDDTNSMATFEIASEGLGPVTLAVTKADLPPGVMGLDPAGPFAFAGQVGGVISPSMIPLVLTNAGGLPFDWVAAASEPWLVVAPASGTLAPQASVTVRLSPAAVASLLPEGAYAGSVGFTNLTSGLGNASRSVSLRVGAAPTVQLQVDVNRPDWGAVEPQGGAYAEGSMVELRAIPSTYYRFVEWRGGVASTLNPFPIRMDADLRVEGVFAELLTVNHPTPLWWLASHGITADFETAVEWVGANGIRVWESYVAGLDPNDPQSRLILSGAPAPGGAVFLLRWNPVPDRVYSLYRTTDPAQGWAPIPGAQRMAGDVPSFGDPVDPDLPARFYQLRVELP